MSTKCSIAASAPVAGRRPRILMLTSGDLFGGAERQLITLCRAGANEFDSVIFQTLRGPLGSAVREADLSLREDLLGASVLQTSRKLARIIETEGFDLIHTHGYRGSVLAALSVAFGAKVPVVRTLHGAPERSKPKVALFQALGTLADWYTHAEQVYVSFDLATRLKAGKRARIIHNGVGMSADHGARPQAYTGPGPHIVAVGRLEPIKGLPYLIAALAENAVSEQVQLHLVGDGPDRAALQAQARQLGVADRVHFHGFRPNDVFSFIGHADALVLPSLHEGVPYVLLEALTFGTPVIASDVGGIPEVVKQGESAILVPPKSPAHLAQAIQTVTKDLELPARFARNAHSLLEAQFSADAMARRYGELYRTGIAA